MGFIAALQFLTLLPIRRNFTGKQVGGATVYFPLVGVLIGLVLVGLNYVLRLVLPPALTAALLMVALAFMSGGLHLDGLADTMDGLAGHRTAEQRLEIMRDSRIGGFGAIGLALFLILEYASIISLPDRWLPYALLLAPVLSRWSMVGSIFFYPYARPSGLGKAFKEAVKWQHFVIATLVTVLLTVVILKAAGLAALAGVCLIVLLMASHFTYHLKGLTGDTYGAINEVTTVGVFIVVSLLAKNGWLLPS